MSDPTVPAITAASTPRHALPAPQRYHQVEWLHEFGHKQPHIHAAQWLHAADKRDLDMIQALTEHGQQAGVKLHVWPTFSGTSGNVELGSWVIRDEHGNVIVMADAHFRYRYEVCRSRAAECGLDNWVPLPEGRTDA